MRALQPPDTHCLSAAVGWLELGNLAEAKAELAQVQGPHQSHPDVLEVRWLIAAEEHQWQEGLQVAESLIKAAPERPSSWLHQAYAVRRIPGGTVQKAWDALLPAYEKFPKEPVIPYNLSCYACQMEQLDVARLWLKRAAEVGSKERIKRMALEDPDLKPLWQEIRDLY